MAMEFIPHGNLYDWLRSEGTNGGKLLGWEMRFRIAMYPLLYSRVLNCLTQLIFDLREGFGLWNAVLA